MSSNDADRCRSKDAPPPAHVDQLALDTAREIAAPDGRIFKGGDCQRLVAIQIAVVAALDRAAHSKDA